MKLFVCLLACRTGRSIQVDSRHYFSGRGIWREGEAKNLFPLPSLKSPGNYSLWWNTPLSSSLCASLCGGHYLIREKVYFILAYY